MFWYKVVLGGKIASKSSSNTRHWNNWWTYHYYCYTSLPRIVTLILKKKHNTAWDHPLCRISVVVQIVWNSLGLHWCTCQDDGKQCILGGKGEDPMCPVTLELGWLPSFIFSHTPGSQVLCLFCPKLCLFPHRFLHCEWLHCCLSSLCLFILKRTLRSVTYPFYFPHFPLWL